MSDILRFECAKARATLRGVKLRLRQAEDLLNLNYGIGINLALIGRIRAAEMSIAEARTTLRRIDPTAAE
jgi:hypothetical protein